MSDNKIEIVNEDGKLIGRDTETGEIVPIEIGSVSTEELNSTDSPKDGSQLQSLFDNLSQGQTIQLRPNTTYTLSEGLAVEGVDDVTVIGPRSATLEFESSGTEETFFTVGLNDDARRITFQGFTIDGTNQAASSTVGITNTTDGHGILADDGRGDDYDVSNITIRHMRFEDVKDHAVGFHSQANRENFNSWVINNEMIDSHENAVHPHNDHTIWAVNNYINNPTVTPGDYAFRHSHLIAGNTIVAWDNQQAIDGTDRIGGTIAYNIIYNHGGVAIRSDGPRDHIFGNRVWGNKKPGSAGIRAGQGSSVMNNYVVETSNQAYRFTGSVRAEGNYARDIDDPVIRIASGDVSIQGGRLIDGNNSWPMIHIFEATGAVIKDVEMISTESSGEPSMAINEASGGNEAQETVIRGIDVSNLNVDSQMFGTNDDALIRDVRGYTLTTTLNSDGDATWNDETHLLDGSSNTVTATLPDPTAHPDQEIRFLATDVTNSVDVSPNDNENINGANSNVSFSSAFDQMVFVTDGTDWYALEASGAS